MEYRECIFFTFPLREVGDSYVSYVKMVQRGGGSRQASESRVFLARIR